MTQRSIARQGRRAGSGPAVLPAPPTPTFPAIPPADVLGRLAALQSTPTTQLKQAVARAVRQGAAALQPRLPPEQACLPHPGSRLWRAEARDTRPAGGTRGAAGRRQRGPAAGPGRQLPLGRHPPVARVAGGGARGHRAGGGLRVRGPALPLPLGGGAAHHRHAVERLDLLRP